MTTIRRFAPIVLVSGLIVGALCSGWDWVMALTGWYKDVSMSKAVQLIFPLLMLGLLGGLWQTAKRGLRFRRQVLAGVVMAMVAGLVLAVSSLLLAGLVIPSYLAERQETYKQTLRQHGMTDAEIAAVFAAHPVPSASRHAVESFVGAAVMGSLGSVLLSIFVRSRGTQLESQS